MNQIAKAIVAAATAVATWAATALPDDQVTAEEAVTVVCATVVAFFLVWAVPNTGRKS